MGRTRWVRRWGMLPILIGLALAGSVGRVSGADGTPPARLEASPGATPTATTRLEGTNPEDLYDALLREAVPPDILPPGRLPAEI